MLNYDAKKEVNKVINDFLMQAMQDGFVLEATEIQNEEWGGVMNLTKEDAERYGFDTQLAVIHYFESTNKTYGHHVKVEYEINYVNPNGRRSKKQHRIVKLKKYDDAEEKFQELLHGDK